jgi:hypothetical protein
MIGARDPRQRDPAFLAYVAKCPCAACMVSGAVVWGVHVAHIRAGSLEHDKRPTGMAEKPSDRWVTPLCPAHHTGDVRRTRVSQHAMGELEFWESFGINPFDLATALFDAFERGQSGPAVIATFAARGRRALEDAPRG